MEQYYVVWFKKILTCLIARREHGKGENLKTRIKCVFL